MSEYAPKKRTALVLAGCGTSGAYHAGVLQALDESGVKIDLIVGSGAGTVAAAWGAVAGGPRLYRQGGFWDGLRWRGLYRLRPALRIGLLLLGASFGVFLLPLGVALLAGLLFPVALIVSLTAPGVPSRWLDLPVELLPALQSVYLAAFAAPVFVLAVLAVLGLVRLALGWRRRGGESLEALLDARAGRERLRRGLWQIARGASLSGPPPAEAEIGRRYAALLGENLGQPGFRELILRVADLELGGPLSFALLADEHRAPFAGRDRGGERPAPRGVDLREPEVAPLLFEAVMAGLTPVGVAPVRRVRFPRGAPYGGEVHRLADATLVGGTGLGEALAAGAEQVILAGAVPAPLSRPARRRGPHALADAACAALERQAFERDVAEAERINRLVATLGRRAEEGRAWQDPATGRLYREVPVYVIRPERRALGPLELDGSRDPATEAEQNVEELIERGYRDAYRMFVEPVVGAASEPRRRRREEPGDEEAPQRVEL